MFIEIRWQIYERLFLLLSRIASARKRIGERGRKHPVPQCAYRLSIFLATGIPEQAKGKEKRELRLRACARNFLTRRSLSLSLRVDQIRRNEINPSFTAVYEIDRASCTCSPCNLREYDATATRTDRRLKRIESNRIEVVICSLGHPLIILCAFQ